MMQESNHTSNSVRPTCLGNCPGIPATVPERLAVRAGVETYVRDNSLQPPLDRTELLEATREFLRQHALPPGWETYVAILLNNAVWQDRLAAIPPQRRLLLLPQCLRAAETCPAEIDALGLYCQKCGQCMIGEFLAEAERLGYVTLVAEGSAVVMKLIESGQVEAVIGVSCLDALEKVFPYIEAGAVPGLAIPLLRDGCVNTAVDTDWVWDALYLTKEDQGPGRVNFKELREEVDAYFAPDSLEELLWCPAGPGTAAQRIAMDWLLTGGKRWRPFLLAAVWRAMQTDAEAPLPSYLRSLAMAVECFHKASLIHDDMEDDDTQRYGRPTVHVAHGAAVALNVGDLLLGEGYRLLAEAELPPETRAAMLRVAADGHRRLCLGQGEELDWATRPRPLSLEQVLEIMQYKTAPAFEVALRIGAIAAGAEQDQLDALGRYSLALGTAYQIRDDLDDLIGDGSDLRAERPNAVLALAGPHADPALQELLDRFWRREEMSAEQIESLRKELRRRNVEHQAMMLMEEYKTTALAEIRTLRQPDLKALLRRVLGKIFADVETMLCCDDLRPNS
jgi:geranylgeranyl pyrophosphate synthase